MPTEKNYSRASVFATKASYRSVLDQIKAKKLNYLIKDFISSNFIRRFSFLLSNSEVSSVRKFAYVSY